MKNVNANKQMSKKKTGRCKKKTNKWQYSHTPPEKIKKKGKQSHDEKTGTNKLEHK